VVYSLYSCSHVIEAAIQATQLVLYLMLIDVFISSIVLEESVPYFLLPILILALSLGWSASSSSTYLLEFCVVYLRQSQRTCRLGCFDSILYSSSHSLLTWVQISLLSTGYMVTLHQPGKSIWYFLSYGDNGQLFLVFFLGRFSPDSTL